MRKAVWAALILGTGGAVLVVWKKKENLESLIEAIKNVGKD